MHITELQVVNACLATVGEIPLIELQDDHPLVAAARANLQEALISELHKKWWFNTDEIVLKPTVGTRFVYAPQDAIEVVVHNRPEFILRGRRLYDRSSSTYEIKDGTLYCTVVRGLKFEEMPVSAQLLVQHATVLRFQVNYDSDSQKTAQLSSLYQQQYMLVNAEHSRQVRYNALEKADTLRDRMNAGVTNRHWGVPVR